MGNERNMYTVEEALVSVGFGKFQFFVFLYSGIGYAAEAMELMILSFIGSPIQSEWKLSPRQESLISSVVFAGMLLGQYSWGVISDNYGRRKGFIFTALVTSGAGFLSAFSPNYNTFIILRFLVGIGLGGGPVLFSWFLEFVPATNRGIWMTIFSFCWSLGTILEASLAWVVMPNMGWRWLLALSSLPVLLLLLFYSFTPESPRYLCTKGRTTDAIKVLEKMARTNNMALPYGSLISDIRGELDGEENVPETSHLIIVQRDRTPVLHNMKSKIGFFTTLSNLLSPTLVRSTLLLWIGFFGNIFAYYGIVLLTSALSDGKMACTSPKLQLNHTEDENLYKDVFITSFAELPGLLLLAVMVDRFGRKITMIIMLFTAFVSLIPLAFLHTEGLTTTLLFCTRLCITASSTCLCIYAPELYPTSLRSSGYGTASAMGRIGGIISPLVAVALVDDCHQTEAILLFEFVISLSAIVVAFFPVETKGRGLDDSLESLIS
ncbi:LOW QUALITY PROTEIN: organic cation/carnitine transporter 7-like [Phalaenopsis equestris]|uniref:LOW QUALITY PROTEIN: organic cation/carnitine transporter 7-like n=1 Tax=Phalaenopsis equestris TaxID=78828 RepID=UPI0009E3BDDE|nr:LOW QUALITY PROTEIN: organic cation/carnitine transporter 7-like [Phalaenopsis equestris]